MVTPELAIQDLHLQGLRQKNVNDVLQYSWLRHFDGKEIFPFNDNVTMHNIVTQGDEGQWPPQWLLSPTLYMFRKYATLGITLGLSSEFGYDVHVLDDSNTECAYTILCYNVSKIDEDAELKERFARMLQ